MIGRRVAPPSGTTVYPYTVLQSKCLYQEWSDAENSRSYILVNMTSFANKMQISLWQIATVIPILGARTSVRICLIRSIRHPKMADLRPFRIAWERPTEYLCSAAQRSVISNLQTNQNECNNSTSKMHNHKRYIAVKWKKEVIRKNGKSTIKNKYWQ